MAALARVQAAGTALAVELHELLDVLHRSYMTPVPQQMRKVVKGINGCYTRAEYGSARGHPDFRVQRWDLVMPIVEYVNKLNLLASLSNARYEIVIYQLVSGEHIFLRPSTEANRWDQACGTARFDVTMMTEWIRDTGVDDRDRRRQQLETQRSRAVVTYLYRFLVMMFHREKGRHQLVGELIALRLRDNDGRHLGALYDQALRMYLQLEPYDRQEYAIFRDMRTLMRACVSQGNPRDKALNISRFLDNTIDQFRLDEGLEGASGQVLDGLVSRAVEFCSKSYERDLGPLEGNAKGEAATVSPKRPDRYREYRNERGQFKGPQTPPAPVPVVHAVQAEGPSAEMREISSMLQAIVQHNDGQRKREREPAAEAPTAGVQPGSKGWGDREGFGISSGRSDRDLRGGREGPDGRDYRNDRGQRGGRGDQDSRDHRGDRGQRGGRGGRWEDGSSKRARVNEEELRVNSIYGYGRQREATDHERLSHLQSTEELREQRCFICGNPTHKAGACDCACTAGDKSGIAGTFNIQAFTELCVKPFSVRADSRAEFEKRMGWYRKTRSYQTNKPDYVVTAADRWAKASAQVRAEYTEMAARHTFSS